MLRFLGIYLILSSLFFSCRSAKEIVKLENGKKLSLISYSGSKSVKLRTRISFKDAYISGITVVKQEKDTIRGVFMNEFGLKAFEFEIVENKCKLYNVMNKIDKWYIKRTISEDFAFLFSINYTTKSSKRIEIERIKEKYIYYFDNNGRITKIERFRGDKTGELILKSEKRFVLENLKRNINYSMEIIGK